MNPSPEGSVYGPGGSELPLKELGESINRTFDSKEPRPCRRCGKEWTPSLWNFYDLCVLCFSLFNTQKMEGRFGNLVVQMGIAASGTEMSPYFESCEKWMEAHPYEEGK